MTTSAFAGFPPATIKFLKQLQKNNDRDWFAEHKPKYESDVLEPALAFITAMQKPMARLSECFNVIPKRTGGSLLRIYRDTRFSKDKTPYKTNIGIHFRHMVGKDVHAPGFYVHVEPDNVFVGAGIWHPDASALASIREAIDEAPAAWKRARDNKGFRTQFKLTGDSLKRPPRGYDAEHPMVEDLKRKDFIGITQLPTAAIESPAFAADVAKSFKATLPLMRFLCGAMELPI